MVLSLPARSRVSSGPWWDSSTVVQSGAEWCRVVQSKDGTAVYRRVVQCSAEYWWDW